jgi:hypothetical protein
MPIAQTRRDHSDTWLVPPEAPIKPDQIPEMSAVDLRALSEKMKKKELMDIEWRRQQVCMRAGRHELCNGVGVF